jgi:AGCS family alanine or glycine:cation symporter
MINKRTNISSFVKQGFMLFLAAFLFTSPMIASAQQTPGEILDAQKNVIKPCAKKEKNLDETVNCAISPVTAAISKVIFAPLLSVKDENNVQEVDKSGKNIALPLIVVWLFVAAIFFTIFFRFINFRGFKTALKIVRGDYTDPHKKSDGEVTHFQALSAALSGTVGLGNIGGVAVAISLGGPGATFWMIVIGFLSMSSKFAECTLGVMYRDVHEDGTVSGGPMYYLKKGLAEKNMPILGTVLAALFAVCCIFASFGSGNIFQISQATDQLVSVTGGADSIFAQNRIWLGLGISFLVGVVIIGGIKSIAKVTSKLVPIMCLIYLVAALSILFGAYDKIPEALASIFSGAFTPEAGFGGIIGVLIQGMRRATFSNEAGIGSAAIAHAAVKTDEPVTEGLVALLEPFIDTIIVCTMTALVIIITGVYDVPNPESGVILTSQAFASVFDWFPLILTVIVILFAFSTMVTWSYYGLKSWTYLFGESKISEITYKLCFMLVTVGGSTMSLGQIVNFADAALFSMSFPNLIGVLILAPVVKKALDRYLARVKSGEIKDFRAEAKSTSAQVQ